MTTNISLEERLAAVEAAIESGLVTNYPDSTKLTPNRGATRADTAALVYEALAKQGKVKQIQK